MIGMIPVDNTGPLQAVRDFLRLLLERGAVEALYVPLESEQGTILPALVTDPDRLGLANPLAPVMAINGARAVSALTGKQAPARIGAVLRPCEIRALIELAKLQQASLESLVIIGVDCPGTVEMNDFILSQRNGGLDLTAFLQAAAQGEAPLTPSLRPACQICVHPVPQGAEIQLHLFGAELSRGIPVSLEEEIAGELEMLEDQPMDGDHRRETLDHLMAAREQARGEKLAAINVQITSDGGLPGLFAACIRCHNCMNACPICYCKTCLFKSAAFDHPPEHYLNAVRRKGALRMLSDTLLFHMTRLNHMSASCVSCGMCTSACPADIQVGTIFSAIGAQVQAAFDYVPGRDLAEPLPLITFQPDEWTEIGESR
jgi:formate dehydrogenase subunit beta